MSDRAVPPETDAPSPADIAAAFHVYETRSEGDSVRYVGEPLAPPDEVYERLRPVFRRAGYDVQLRPPDGQGVHVLVAEPLGVRGVPWTNLVLFLATVVSTLFVGATVWYYVPLSVIASDPSALLRAWPFTAAVLGVLGVHELGHYATSRWYDVPASLPYFIPVPTIIGTMGAVIKLEGRMPDRRSLFDIGAAGPIAGLAATVVVTAIGLSLDPVTAPQHVVEGASQGIRLRNPLLLDLIGAALNEPTAYPAGDPRQLNPVVIGGWVGMFVTFLNLIPVGQLDGGHMVRAMVGRRSETVAALVPGALFTLAGYLYYVRGLGLQDSVLLWAVWGGFATLLAFNGAADPVTEGSIGRKRQLVGLATFAVGLLCFTPVPFEVVPA